MNALITGSNGLLGHHLTEMKNMTFIGLSKGENTNPNIMDGDYINYNMTIKGSLFYLLNKYEWVDVFIHCAAYTNVDKAESDAQALKELNVDATKELCDVAVKMKKKLIYISTDYVFDGVTGNYSEKSKPNPINAYGKSKLEAEEYILKTHLNSLVIRTSTPYTYKSHKKVDFARWVYNELRDGKQIKVVTDQISNPTYLPHLADAIYSLMGSNLKGIAHIAGDLPISRYNFAKAIAKEAGFDPNLIIPVTTADLDQAANRPLNSSLDTSSWQNVNPQKWHLPMHEGFNQFIKKMKTEERKMTRAATRHSKAKK